MNCKSCGKVQKLGAPDVVLVQRELIEMRAKIISLKNKGGKQSPAITRELVSAAGHIDMAMKDLKKVQGLLR